MKEKINRNEVVRLRKEGWTGRQIGFHFGVTRQRISQIGQKMPPEEAKLFGHRSIRVTSPCGSCGKDVVSFISRQKKYCDFSCYMATHKKYKTKEEARTANQENQNARYKNDPGFRERHKIAVKKSLEKLKKDPKRWAARKAAQYAYYKEWIKRKRNKA